MGFLREILGRPQNERPYLLIPAGYPAANAEVRVLEEESLSGVMTLV